MSLRVQCARTPREPKSIDRWGAKRLENGSLLLWNPLFIILIFDPNREAKPDRLCACGQRHARHEHRDPLKGF